MKQNRIPRQRHSTSLELTWLQDRATPATHTWTGSGITDNWSEAANWTGGVPTSNEPGGTIVAMQANSANSIQNISGLIIDRLVFFNSSAITITLNQSLSLRTTTFGDDLINSTGNNTINGPGALNFTNLRRLFGDSDGNGTVDGSDFAAFGNAFGNTVTASPFDFENNGTIDGSDLVQLGNRFGVGL